jgi:hypothetical protein
LWLLSLLPPIPASPGRASAIHVFLVSRRHMLDPSSFHEATAVVKSLV